MMPKEQNIHIEFHGVLVPMLASHLTNAIFTNKLVHLEKGTPATEKEIENEVFEIWDAIFSKLSGKVAENLGAKIKAD